MIRAAGTCFRTPDMIWPMGSSDQRSNSPAGRTPAQEFENLHGVDAGAELRGKVVDRSFDQFVDENLETGRIAIGEKARRRLVGRASARDHIARHRPWRATKAEKGGFLRQVRSDAIDGFEHGRQAIQGQGRKLFDIGGADKRLQTRTFPSFEHHLLPERIGHDKNVAEEYGGVETEAPDRLKRGLGSQGGRIAELDEIIGPGSDLTIFGQVASCLPHEPDRPRRGYFAVEDGKHRLAVFAVVLIAALLHCRPIL